MSRTAGVHDTLVYRLSQVLTKLNLGESLDPQALANEFGVTLRTVQRDLNVRFACLPLVKSDGRYRLEQTQLGRLTTKDIERFHTFLSRTIRDGSLMSINKTSFFKAKYSLQTQN